MHLASTLALTLPFISTNLGTVHNSTSGRDFTLYIGLRSVVYVDCLFQPGYEKYNGNCDPQSIEWSSDQCKSSSVVGLACDACSSAAISLWLTSVASVVGLVLALLGAQTRMRVASDIPIQKLLGAIADTCGALSLIFTLLLFHTNCVYPLHNAFNVAHLNPVFWSGPGVYAYSICAVSGGIRAVVHWLTPLPGVIPMCGPKSAYQRAPISATSFRSEKPTVVWSESTNPIQSSFRAESLLTESSFQIEMTSNVKSDFKTDLKSDVKSGDRKGHHREVPTDEDGYDYQNIL